MDLKNYGRPLEQDEIVNLRQLTLPFATQERTQWLWTKEPYKRPLGKIYKALDIVFRLFIVASLIAPMFAQSIYLERLQTLGLILIWISIVLGFFMTFLILGITLVKAGENKDLWLSKDNLNIFWKKPKGLRRMYAVGNDHYSILAPRVEWPLYNSLCVVSELWASKVPAIRRQRADTSDR